MMIENTQSNLVRSIHAEDVRGAEEHKAETGRFQAIPKQDRFR